MSRIDINISAEDPTEGDLVSRLLTSALTNNGFEDVTSMTHNTHIETQEDVVIAMRGMNSSIFTSEITIGVSNYEPESPTDLDSIGGEDLDSDPDAD